jgi:hypothetical protein
MCAPRKPPHRFSALAAPRGAAEAGRAAAPTRLPDRSVQHAMAPRRPSPPGLAALSVIAFPRPRRLPCRRRASDDWSDANRIRNLVADIEDVRRCKVRLPSPSTSNDRYKIFAPGCPLRLLSHFEIPAVSPSFSALPSPLVAMLGVGHQTPYPPTRMHVAPPVPSFVLPLPYRAELWQL